MLSFKLTLVPLAIAAYMAATIFAAPMPLTDAEKIANGQRLNQLRSANFQRSLQLCGPNNNSAAFQQCQRIFFFQEDAKLIRQFKGKTDKATFDQFMRDKDALNTNKNDIRDLVFRGQRQP